MKKIISFFLAAVFAFSACTTAYAVTETPYDNSEFYTQGDYEIHYRVIEHSGDFKGRIMFLHGFLCSTYAWRNMAQNLSAEGYDCVLADLPNFGYSTRETADTENIDREDLIIGLMKSISPDGEWLLAGHSMGGGVAVNIAEKFPVKALLLFCPAPQSTCPKGFEKVVTSVIMKAMMNGFFTVGTKLSPVVKLVVWAATNNAQFAMNYDVSGVTAPFKYKGIGAGMCEMLVRVRETDLDNAGSITCPILLVNAEKDIIINDSMRSAFLTAFPDAKTYVVSGAGHQCIEDRADELCGLVTEFLG